MQLFSPGGPEEPPGPEWPPSSSGTSKEDRLRQRRFVAFEFATPPPVEAYPPMDETDGLSAFLFELISNKTSLVAEPPAFSDSPAAVGTQAAAAAAAFEWEEANPSLPWGPQGHAGPGSSTRMSPPWGPQGGPPASLSLAGSPDGPHQLRHQLQPQLQQQQQQPQQQQQQQQRQQQLQEDSDPSNLPIEEQLQRLRRLAKARGPRGPPKEKERSAGQQSDIRSYLVPSRCLPQQQQEQQQQQQQQQEAQEEDWPDVPLEDLEDIDAGQPAAEAWGPWLPLPSVGSDIPDERAGAPWGPPHSVEVEGAPSLHRSSPLGAPKGPPAESPFASDSNAGEGEAAKVTPQASACSEQPEDDAWAPVCSADSPRGLAGQGVFLLESPEAAAEGLHAAQRGGPPTGDRRAAAEGGPRKKKTAAKEKTKKSPKKPKGPLIFDPVAAWDALFSEWSRRSDVQFICSCAAFSSFASAHFPSASWGAPPPAEGWGALSPEASSSGAPEAARCCWVFSVLSEDGSASSLTSKKLDAARFSNKSLRARFPRPVGLLFSRGILPEGPPGRPSVLAVDKGGGPLNALAQGAPQGWQHFVIPLADFAVKHLQQQQQLHEEQQQQQHEAQQQQQQEQVTPGVVWGFVAELLLSGSRAPLSGGPLLLWNAQEALRPLISEKPAIPSGGVCFLDVCLMVWLWAPDDAQSAEALPPAAAKLQVEPLLVELSASELGVSEGSSSLWLSALKAAEATAAVASALAPSLLSQGLCRVLTEQEGPVALLLSVMETTGIACDDSTLRPHKLQLQAELQRLAKACCAAAGVSFLPSSHKQVADVLYGHLKLKPPLGGPPGGPSKATGPLGAPPAKATPASGRRGPRQLCTDDQVLQRLRDAHTVVPLLQSYRQIAKLLTTFLEPLTPLSLQPAGGAEGIQETTVGPGGLVGFRVPPGPPGAPAVPSRNKPGGFSTPWAAGRSANQPRYPRVYCRWNQTKTVTGRLSTSYYNMQTIPREVVVLLPDGSPRRLPPDPPPGGPSPLENPAGVGGGQLGSGDSLREVKLRCRDAFVPSDPKTQKLVSADFAQIEMRILAHFCSNGRLARLLQRSGGDPYREMAAAFMKVPIDEVSDELRTRAKTVCLSLLYGGGTQTVCKQLRLSLEEAVRCRQRFAEAFPEVPLFVRDTKAFAAKHKFVTTIAGRRRPVDFERADSAMMLRQAVNSRIQGSASDLIKQAMLAVQRALQSRQEEAFPVGKPVPVFKSGTRPRLLLSLHDELLLECGAEDVLEVSELLRLHMTHAVTLAVPLEVTIKVGASWGDLSSEFLTSC
ncbi:hypothetical protein Efla_003950 [Eimeria flavescens]